MECEVCGKSVEKSLLVRIEGTEMRTCRRCSKFGIVLEKDTVVHRPSPIRREKIIECVDNYNELVRKARERMHLTQEEFGKKINEKTSVITRLESGKMIPDDKLARKLENFLNIRIFQKADDELVEHTTTPGKELTIGDIIKRKIK